MGNEERVHSVFWQLGDIPLHSKKATIFGRFSDGMYGGEPWLCKSTIRRSVLIRLRYAKRIKKRELLKLSMGWLHHPLNGVIRLPPYLGVLLNPTIPCYVQYRLPRSVYSPRASQSPLTYSSVPFHRIETAVHQYLEELSLGQPTS